MTTFGRRLAVLLAASTVALLGCGGAGPASSGGSSPTGGPSGTMRPMASDAPIGSPAASPVAASFPPARPFAFGSAEPVITTALAGMPDEKYVNPGAVIAASDGVLHAFANVFTPWPGPVTVVHLTSKDGLRWARVGPVPAMSSAKLPFGTFGSDVSAGIVLDDGTWVVIIESVSSFKPWELYEATAPGPDGPWTVDPNPILGAGAAGVIDAGGLQWPAIVKGPSGYLLYYAAIPAGSGPAVIAVATSVNGRSWQRPVDPILVPDREFEGTAVNRPRVARLGDGFVMLYSGTPITNRGEAISSDGLTWTKVGDGPVIDRGRFPVDGGAWDAALVSIGGRLEYLLEIGTDGKQTADFSAMTP